LALGLHRPQRIRWLFPARTGRSRDQQRQRGTLPGVPQARARLASPGVLPPRRTWWGGGGGPMRTDPTGLRTILGVTLRSLSRPSRHGLELRGASLRQAITPRPVRSRDPTKYYGLAVKCGHELGRAILHDPEAPVSVSPSCLLAERPLSGTARRATRARSRLPKRDTPPHSFFHGTGDASRWNLWTPGAADACCAAFSHQGAARRGAPSLLAPLAGTWTAPSRRPSAPPRCSAPSSGRRALTTRRP